MTQVPKFMQTLSFFPAAVVLASVSAIVWSNTTGLNHRIPLDQWTFRSLNGSICINNAVIPGSSHIHLLQAGLLDDPYYRNNEQVYQWVALDTWVYETQVTFEHYPTKLQTKLVFETLDGVARVMVNNKQVARTVNSFLRYQIDVTTVLQRGVNQIQVAFEPVIEYTKRQAQKYPYFVPMSMNFNTWTEPTYRSFVRKAGSDFGWDWGPAYLTSGITGLAFIEIQQPVIKLKDLHVVQVFPSRKTDLSIVDVTVSVMLEGGQVRHENVTFDLFVNDVRKTSITTTISKNWMENATIDLMFRLDNPKLWWPAGYGESYLYNLRVDAWNAQFNVSLFHKSGIRLVELIQDDTNAGNATGKTFYFRVNRVPVFIKGANWIPTDSFPTRTKRSMVRHLLESVRAANMNMIRVWGGGRYESDYFYAVCDQLGILVWQELMYACGMYPRDAAFLENAVKEVRYQVGRLRKYTSIAVWGGNNENENMMEQFVEAPIFPPGMTFNRDIAVVDFTKLFVDLLYPAIVAMDPGRPFVDTSPSNGLYSADPYVKRWGDSNGVAFGDVHFYDYINDCQRYEMYPRARFISEFGFQSWPSASLLRVVSSKEDWSSFQAFWKFLKYRQRHENGTTQMLTQLKRRFHVPFPFHDEEWLSEKSGIREDEALGCNISKRIESYLYLTQIQQSLCYQTAIQTWRRGKNLDLGMTMGILYWQLNDIWQGSSWSSIEYSGRWKSLHYVAKREFAPFIISIHEQSDSRTLQVYGVSDVTHNLHVDVIYEIRQTNCGSLVKSIIRQAVPIAALKSRLIEELDVDTLLGHDGTTSCHRRSCYLQILCVAKSSETGSEMASVCEDTHYFFAPFKHLSLGQGDVSVHSVVRTVADNANAFSVELVSTDFLALFVEIDVLGVLGYWSFNSFLMLGNSSKTLNFTVTDPQDIASFTSATFTQLLTLNWLQKSYDNAIMDATIQ